MQVIPYDRESAVAYAQKWAYSRNPNYLNFNGIGGDCTNFVSQSVFAGCGVMNFTPTFGWFYKTASNRTASWTGVPYFYNFMVSNQSVGPFAQETALTQLLLGDVIQLGTADDRWYHSMLVTGFQEGGSPAERVLISTHSYDSNLRPLSSYTFERLRCLHIEGARKE